MLIPSQVYPSVDQEGVGRFGIGERQGPRAAAGLQCRTPSPIVELYDSFIQ